MLHYSVFAAAFLGLWLLNKIVQYFARQLKNRKDAKAWNCGEIPLVNPGDTFGRGLLKELTKADARKDITGLFVDRFKMMSDMHGRPVHTIQSNMMGQREIATCDPKNIQAMLATQFKDYEMGPSRTKNLASMFGQGIFTQNGHAWEHSRAMLRPNFVRDQVNDIDSLERHIQHLFQAMPTNDSGWTDEVDLQVLFFRQTLDYATDFLFGESVDSQISELPENANKTLSTEGQVKDERAFAWAFDRGQWWLSVRDRRRNFYWTAGGAEFKKCVKITNDFVDHFVRLALQKGNTLSQTEKGEKQRYVFLEALAEQTQDPIELRSQLLNILLAGRDTTASLLSWVFLLLTRHPDVLTKLRAAILADFGSDNDSGTVNFASLKSCTYLQWVMNETLRLYPLVPLNGRYSAHNTTLPRGGGPDGQQPVFVPAGTRVTYSVHVMQRNPAFWGSDVEDLNSFKPDRWASGRHGWEYLPFNGGPRICIGQQFALTEAGYVIVRMLQRFQNVKATMDTLTEGYFKQNQTLINCPADGVKVKLQLA